MCHRPPCPAWTLGVPCLHTAKPDRSLGVRSGQGKSQSRFSELPPTLCISWPLNLLLSNLCWFSCCASDSQSSWKVSQLPQTHSAAFCWEQGHLDQLRKHVDRTEQGARRHFSFPRQCATEHSPTPGKPFPSVLGISPDPVCALCRWELGSENRGTTLLGHGQVCGLAATLASRVPSRPNIFVDLPKAQEDPSVPNSHLSLLLWPAHHTSSNRQAGKC